MMLSDTHLSQKLLELIKIKTLMIKINVISKQDNWKRFLKSPNLYMRDKIRKLNKKVKVLKKNLLYTFIV